MVPHSGDALSALVSISENEIQQKVQVRWGEPGHNWGLAAN